MRPLGGLHTVSSEQVAGQVRGVHGHMSVLYTMWQRSDMHVP